MASMSEWPIKRVSIDNEPEARLFLTDHEWETIEAATARIIPTDRDPGAREARVVRFIDRYLSGIDYVFAAADGSGFLQMNGKIADAWRARITEMQATYRQGIRTLDELASEQFNLEFKRLREDQQDAVLERLSRAPKPGRIPLQGQLEPIGYGTVQIFMFDEGLDFFSALTTHTRQGFYANPVYGGNASQVGWKVIGFPGPRSLKDTMDGTYSQRDYLVLDYAWDELIPHLKHATS